MVRFNKFSASVTKSFGALAEGCEVTETGYLRRRSHVCMFYNRTEAEYTWSHVWTRGMLALIPSDTLIYKAMWKVIEWVKDEETGKHKPVETRFNEAKFNKVCAEMKLKGYVPMFWHDTGIKSEDGEYRLMPFIKEGFSFTEFFNDNFGTDMTHLFQLGKGAKVIKYLNSPWGFLEGNKPTFVDMLVVPLGFDGLDAEGCGTVKDVIAKDRGSVIHFRALAVDRNGRGSWGKGTIKQGAAFSANIKASTLNKIKAECAKNNIDFNTVQGISTDDSFKGAEPWTVVRAAVVWHGDSSRNIKTDCSLGTQMIMNAPLNQRAVLHLEHEMGMRKSEVAVAKNSGSRRGEFIGRWANQCVLENDATPDGKDYTNTIVGDMSKLMMLTNISPAFGYNDRAPRGKKRDRTLMARARVAMGSFLRGRTIGNHRVPGSRMFVIYNQKLNHDECLIGKSFAKYHGIKIGDEITTVKSPVGPMSPRNRKVVGYINDAYVVKGHGSRFDTWIEISNHRGFDFDGDMMDVMAHKYMRYNVELIDHVNKDDNTHRDFRKEYDERCAEINALIDEYSTEIRESSTYHEYVISSYMVLEASRGVGMVEDLRRQFSLVYGQEQAWPMCQAIFELVSEGILIKGKKHNVPIIFDYDGFCKALSDKYNLARANAHRLITSKKTNDARIAEQIAEPQFELIQHENAHLYEQAFNLAVDINELFTCTKSDVDRWKKFKSALASRYRTYIREILEDDNAELYSSLIKFVDTDINLKGDLTKTYTGMKNFYSNARRFTSANFAHLLGVSVEEACKHPLYAEFYELDGFNLSLDKNPNAGRVKKIYRELETAWFQGLEGHHKIAAICGILTWGIYAWLYVFPVEDYIKIISAVDEMIG